MAETVGRHIQARCPRHGITCYHCVAEGIASLDVASDRVEQADRKEELTAPSVTLCARATFRRQKRLDAAVQKEIEKHPSECGFKNPIR